MDDCQISRSDFVFYEQLRFLDCEVFFALFSVLESILLLECSYRTLGHRKHFINSRFWRLVLRRRKQAGCPKMLCHILALSHACCISPVATFTVSVSCQWDDYHCSVYPEVRTNTWVTVPRNSWLKSACHTFICTNLFIYLFCFYLSFETHSHSQVLTVLKMRLA